MRKIARLFFLGLCLGVLLEFGLGPRAWGQCPGGVCPTPLGGVGLARPSMMGPFARGSSPSGASVFGGLSNEAVHRSVVRIVNQQGAVRSLGSGTLVDKNGEHGLILTCAHLFRDGVGSVAVVFSDQHQFGARVIKVDRTWDLAALLIRVPTAECVGVMREAPRLGEGLRSCGYGSDGRYRSNLGKALQYVALGGGELNEAIELSGSARQGDSGGPIFSARGELAGVILGTNGRVVTGPCCVRVRKFLRGLSPRFGPIGRRPNDRRAGEQIAGSQGVGGQRGSGQRVGDQGGDDRRQRDAEGSAVVGLSPRAGGQAKGSLLEKLGEISAHVEGLHDQLEQREKDFANRAKKMGEQVSQVGDLAGRLAGRLAKTEQVLSEGSLRRLLDGAVRQPGARHGLESLAMGAPVSLVLPALLGALGISVPPLLIWLGWIGFRRWRSGRRRKLRGRRRRAGREDRSVAWPPSAHEISRDGDERRATRREESDRRSPVRENPVRELNDDYARQLHDVFSNSGRSPVQDATLGREYDEALGRAAESSDPKLAGWAKKLREQVERKFLRIHGWSPSPAEPLES